MGRTCRCTCRAARRGRCCGKCPASLRALVERQVQHLAGRRRFVDERRAGLERREGELYLADAGAGDLAGTGVGLAGRRVGAEGDGIVGGAVVPPGGHLDAADADRAADDAGRAAASGHVNRAGSLAAHLVGPAIVGGRVVRRRRWPRTGVWLSPGAGAGAGDGQRRARARRRRSPTPP